MKPSIARWGKSIKTIMHKILQININLMKTDLEQKLSSFGFLVAMDLESTVS